MCFRAFFSCLSLSRDQLKHQPGYCHVFAIVKYHLKTLYRIPPLKMCVAQISLPIFFLRFPIISIYVLKCNMTKIIADFIFLSIFH